MKVPFKLRPKETSVREATNSAMSSRKSVKGTQGKKELIGDKRMLQSNSLDSMSSR